MHAVTLIGSGESWGPAPTRTPMQPAQVLPPEAVPIGEKGGGPEGTVVRGNRGPCLGFCSSPHFFQQPLDSEKGSPANPSDKP